MRPDMKIFRTSCQLIWKLLSSSDVTWIFFGVQEEFGGHLADNNMRFTGNTIKIVIKVTKLVFFIAKGL